MAQQGIAPYQSNSITSIISPQFCAPYPIDLAVVSKTFAITEGNFDVKDTNGNIVFKVKGKFITLNGRRLLLDAAGNPIVTFRQKTWSMHKRVEVFRGDSSKSKDYIFSVKISSLWQLKTKLDVFLAHNKREKVCDFRIKGSWFTSSCTIYTGESSTVVAKMHEKKGKFMVTVYPNVDYAFIVALIAIADEINTPGDIPSPG